MTKDDIIRMAREAGLERIVGVYADGSRMVEVPNLDLIKRFAALVAAAEREACAKVCEEMRPSKAEYDQRFYDGCTFSAAAIRARGRDAA